MIQVVNCCSWKIDSPVCITVQTLISLVLHVTFVQFSLDPTNPPCPLYENTTIIEQPVNLITLHDKYVDAAKSFIKRTSGEIVM